MEEASISLTLNQAQRSQLFAHMLVYLFSLTLKPAVPRHQVGMEIAQEVAYRLLQFCENESDEMVFLLNPKEAQVIRYVLMMLKPVYEQWPESPVTPLAIEHLTACLLLLREAEQRTSRGTER